MQGWNEIRAQTKQQSAVEVQKATYSTRRPAKVSEENCTDAGIGSHSFLLVYDFCTAKSYSRYRLVTVTRESTAPESIKQAFIQVRKDSKLGNTKRCVTYYSTIVRCFSTTRGAYLLKISIEGRCVSAVFSLAQIFTFTRKTLRERKAGVMETHFQEHNFLPWHEICKARSLNPFLRRASLTRTWLPRRWV